jgi:hypothetical protein
MAHEGCAWVEGYAQCARRGSSIVDTVLFLICFYSYSSPRHTHYACSVAFASVTSKMFLYLLTSTSLSLGVTLSRLLEGLALVGF